MASVLVGCLAGVTVALLVHAVPASLLDAACVLFVESGEARPAPRCEPLGQSGTRPFGLGHETIGG